MFETNEIGSGGKQLSIGVSVIVVLVGIALTGAATGTAAAQPVVEEVNRTYGGGFSDTTASVVEASDGGFVLAGTTTSFGSGLEGAWLVKTDANGNEEFNTTFGGGGTDTVASVVETSDGGYALVGDTRSFGSGGQDVWLVKTDANGNEEFNETFGGTGRDEAITVIETSDGGFAMAGRTNSFGAGDDDAWLIKTGSNGNVEFTKTFGGSDFDGALSVVQTQDGGFALAGVTASFGGGGDNAWLIKTDANGNEVFNRTYGGADSEEMGRLVQTQDGGFAMAGRTNSFGAGDDDAWLIKTGSNGNEQFNRTYGGADFDVGGPIAEASDGGFVLSGLTTSFGSGLQDGWLIKTDANGNEEFNATFGGANFDLLSSVVETSDGSFALAGSTESFGSRLSGAFREAWLLKVSLGDGGGNLSPNNPFADTNGNPVSRRTVIDRVVQWNLSPNNEINGTQFTRREIINFVVQWNMAR